MADIKPLQEVIRKFIEERDWDQHHNPKDLAESIVLEAAELMEHFQWKDEGESKKYAEEHREEIGDECADVFIYLLEFCHQAGIDLIAVAHRKIEKNAVKYPVDKVRGSAKKYTEY